MASVVNGEAQTRILVVNGGTLAGHLRRAGYSVEEVRCGRGALRKVEAAVPDLVIMEMELPDMLGAEVCRLIRTNPASARIPLIQVFDPRAGTGDSVDVLEYGAEQTPRQRYERAELVGFVKALLRAQKAEQELRELNLRLAQRVDEQTAEIRRTYDLLNGLMEGTSDKIAARDRELRFIAFNRAYRDEYEKVFGIEIKIGMSLEESLRHLPEDQDSATRLWQRALQGESFTLERQFGDPGRERKFYEFTFFPIQNRQGEIVGAGHIARDVTARCRAEEALRKANEQLEERVAERTAALASSEQRYRALSDALEGIVQERTAKLRESVAELEHLSYSISHDMRAPLRAMEGFAQALEEEYGALLDAKGRDYLDRIRRACVRQDALIQDVLTYTRGAPERVELKPVDLQRTIEEVLLQYPNLKVPMLELDIPESERWVRGHDVLLAQCFWNLLANAVKFVAPGVSPQVKIWTTRTGSRVRVWVGDNGIGIAPDHQERIFGLFQRLHSDSEYEGTGVGLAVVRKAAERMEGRVGVESRLGQGSRFWIELPRSDKPENG